jgi:hypothetical protein
MAKTLRFYAYKEYFHVASKIEKFRASRARLEAFAGHIWPAGRMLYMAGVGHKKPYKLDRFPIKKVFISLQNTLCMKQSGGHKF